MAATTDHSADDQATRRAREPGVPPRPLVALASVLLAAGTGVAIWLLPGRTDGDWAGRPGTGAAPAPATGATAGRTAEQGAAPAVARPSGFVTFVDAVRDPLFDLPKVARKSRVHWFTVGHLTAGHHGCVPRWGGTREQDGAPVADRLGRLRAAGGDAGLAFGGPAGRELAAACADQARLTAAYRQAIRAFDASYIDFELHDRADAATVFRRARAIATLQREAARAGRPLTVSFTLPVTAAGLSRSDQEMLRATRAAGAEIAAVNLLTPVDHGAGGQRRLLPVASAVRSAQPQIARSLGESAAWHRIALTPVLTGSGDLTEGDARKLLAFTNRNNLAWLSARGAALTPDVTRFLAAQ
ncbi:hypothetical protein GCM10010517_32230 [Streptosporangium fragile]|uniref:Chitinase n=1 Tax=Streptosporangium fragile TaxID=46186 RepID=A0ABP6IDB2_9ACTN